MTMPGFVTNQPLSGRQVGQAITQFLPCLPHEGPPGVPRILARAVFPQGFFPGMIPALPAARAPAPPLVQPPLKPAANQVVPPAPAAPPPPRKRVLERGTFPGWH